MEIDYPEAWGNLEHPWVRAELLAYLEELATPDPRPVWQGERRRGLVSGIDQVFHFFFDDHDFDPSDVGYTLLDSSEADAVGALKRVLNELLSELPNGDDNDYVNHRRWGEASAAATSALGLMKTR